MFIVGGSEAAGHAAEQAAYRLLYGGVWLERRRDIYESHIYVHSVGNRVKQMTVEPVGFAYAPAHCDPVYGMAQTLFRYGYEKLYVRPAGASRIMTPYGAQRKCQRAARAVAGFCCLGSFFIGTYGGLPAAEQQVDGGLGAEFLAFV